MTQYLKNGIFTIQIPDFAAAHINACTWVLQIKRTECKEDSKAKNKEYWEPNLSTLLVSQANICYKLYSKTTRTETRRPKGIARMGKYPMQGAVLNLKRKKDKKRSQI